MVHANIVNVTVKEREKKTFGARISFTNMKKRSRWEWHDKNRRRRSVGLVRQYE